MSEGAVSPKKGLFQSLSKRVSGYRSKKKSEQHPSSPGSQVSESASESLSKQKNRWCRTTFAYSVANLKDR